MDRQRFETVRFAGQQRGMPLRAAGSVALFAGAGAVRAPARVAACRLINHALIRDLPEARISPGEGESTAVPENRKPARR